MTRRADLHRWDALPLQKVTEMVARKVIAGGEITLAQTYLKKGALVPLHTHAGEQAIYVLQGALRAWLSGSAMVVREGEVLVVPEGVKHQLEALDDSFVFTCLSGSGRRPSHPDARRSADASAPSATGSTGT
jgi:quercetin dioxygenase-like cupin family protein